PRGRDHERLLAPLDTEGQMMERAVDLPVLGLRLRDRGLEVDVPHRRGLDAVDVALLVEVAEAQLRQVAAARVDGRVLLCPVDRETDPPPEGLERLLVLTRDLEAELDEVPPRDDAGRLLQTCAARRLEAKPRLVGRGRVDDERVITGSCPVIAMDAEPLPLRVPARLGVGGVEVLRQAGRIDRARHRTMR